MQPPRLPVQVHPGLVEMRHGGARHPFLDGRLHRCQVLVALRYRMLQRRFGQGTVAYFRQHRAGPFARHQLLLVEVDGERLHPGPVLHGCPHRGGKLPHRLGPAPRTAFRLRLMLGHAAGNLDIHDLPTLLTDRRNAL